MHELKKYEQDCRCTHQSSKDQEDDSVDGGGQPPRLALRPKDAAKALGISERSLWTLTNQGVIPHVKLGKSILYPIDVIRKWLADQARPEVNRKNSSRRFAGD